MGSSGDWNSHKNGAWLNMNASDDSNAPAFFVAHFTIKRWENLEKVRGELLIAPKFLDKVNKAVDGFDIELRRLTLPVLGEHIRLLRLMDALEVARITSTWSHLKPAIEELQGRWNEVLDDAKARLRKHFCADDYPSVDLLHDCWMLDISFGEQIMNTREILGAHSFFQSSDGN